MTGTGQRHSCSNTLRGYAGALAMEFNREGKEGGKHGVSNPYLLKTLKALDKPEVLADKRAKDWLRDMVLKAYHACVRKTISISHCTTKTSSTSKRSSQTHTAFSPYHYTAKLRDMFLGLSPSMKALQDHTSHNGKSTMVS